ncbi:copia protein, partial [Tanacetum coccineum]
ICLGVDLEPDEWIKDSGCSKYMTGNRKLFSSYKAYNRCNVIFGSNLRGQICDNKCKVTFSEHDSEITKDGKVIGRGIRKKGLYVMKLGNKPKDQICIATIDENSTLWHRRLAHASHKAKNIVSTTRCLELLHMDLFGPSSVRSYEGNRYTLVIVDDYSRLVAQGYNQHFEGASVIPYAPVARLDSIWILLAYACALDFKLFQMDVKSAFLNGFINEEKSNQSENPMSSDTKLTKDEDYELVDRNKYQGMIGLWFSKKQTALAISTTEAEYVSARKACQQALWMKQDLIDYDVRLDDVSIMYDNKGAIDLSKNSLQHSQTKHIEIRHHFLCDNVQKEHISIEKVPFVDIIADILTKLLKRESFKYLRLGLGMMEHIT